MRSTRRATTIGVAAAGAALAAASAAFACTAYYGKTTVSDVDSNGVTWSAFSDGSGGVHGYCPFPGLVGGYPARQPVDLTGTFTVSVGATTTCVGGQNSLASASGTGGTYEVRWLDVTGATTLLNSCNAGAGASVLGTLSVSSGTGSTSSVSVPSGFTAGEVNICVAKAGNTPSDPSAPEVWLHVI